MLERFGPRLGALLAGSSELAVAGSITLAVAVSGCAGKALVVGEERPASSSGEDPGEPGGVNGIVPASELALLGDCPLSAETWRERSECWSTRHAGRWRGFFTGVPRYATTGGRVAEFPAGDVLLELNSGGLGRLTFGAPQTGWSANGMPLVPCDEPEGPPGCDQLGLLLAGFGYGLETVELFEPLDGPPNPLDESPTTIPAGMSFEVRVGEPWDAWCAAQEPTPGACIAGDCLGGNSPPALPGANDSSVASVGDEPAGCRCSETGCVPDAPSLRIELDMSSDADALRGSYAPNDPSIAPARLQFLKERLP